jgi:hypothetical protein
MDIDCETELRARAARYRQIARELDEISIRRAVEAEADRLDGEAQCWARATMWWSAMTAPAAQKPPTTQRGVPGPHSIELRPARASHPQDASADEKGGA